MGLARISRQSMKTSIARLDDDGDGVGEDLGSAHKHNMVLDE